MRKIWDKFKAMYYGLPPVFYAVLLVGCEVSATFSLSAMVLLRSRELFADPYWALSLADNFGTVGQRAPVVAVMIATALILADRILSLREERRQGPGA